MKRVYSELIRPELFKWVGRYLGIVELEIVVPILREKEGDVLPSADLNFLRPP